MKRANKQIQGRLVSRGADKQGKTTFRRRLLLEGLEQRQLLAVSPMGTFWGVNDVGLRSDTVARNINTVNSLQVLDAGVNDTLAQAQLVPLGTGSQSFDTIDITGELTLGDFAQRTTEDIDYYAVDLQAGDILDIATLGSIGAIDVFHPGGNLWFAAEADASGGGTAYPFESPLQTLGDITIAQTVPQSGRYYIRAVSDGVSEGIYTMGLRVYRPALESAPVGTQQVLFLDFNGESFLRSDLGSPEFDPAFTGVARLSPLENFVDAWGLNPEDENEIIDRIVAIVEENFLEDIALKGNNGSYAQTGIAGQFGITVLNSRDHADPFGSNPYVSRVIVGGTVGEAGFDTVGLAASNDVGNFDTSESAFVLLDEIAPEIIPIPRTPSYTIIDTISTFLGNVVTHEAAHFFGAWHQNNTNSLVSIADQGGDFEGFTGTGPDGIFGNADDQDVDFTNDFFSPIEGVAIGRQDTINAMAFNLSTGMAGGNVSGTVFNDVNRNQIQGSGELGIAGVVVFADLNNNGVFEVSEPSATTTASGDYSLAAPEGTVTIRALAPAGFVATTALSRSVTVGLNQTADADFGFYGVVPDVTGFKWNDLNGDGIRDTGEPGIAGVYVYLDLDGDDRIDLGEPRAITKANGSYTLVFPSASNLPSPGPYAIREVLEPGMQQTYPPTGEWLIMLDGSQQLQNYDFGNESVLDFGDAPAPYPTLAANNGASHGVTAGFGLGALTDAEADGQPTPNALGDDLDGSNDDDGVLQLSPLSPGSSTNLIGVSVRNAPGATSYLSAWLDLNQDGDWNDPGEKILSDRQFVGTVTETLQFSLPASAQIGDTFVRFRLSPSQGTGPTGFVSAGEVEDYQVTLVETPNVANDDFREVPRGSINFPLDDLLDNDFDSPLDPLTITLVDEPEGGQAFVSTDGRTIFYTPRGDFLGTDSLVYSVSNASGTVTGTATVTLNVIFQSAVPIAVDNTYNLPSGVINQTLDVLENDVPSVAGGNRILSVSAPDQNGQVRISTDRQRLIYSPATGFSGTERFNYTVTDLDGATSTATVTVHLQPGAQSDDEAAFIVQTFANDGVTQIQTIEAGQLFKVRVSVEDLRNISALGKGVDAAYLDLLYTDGLVTTVPSTDPNSEFPYEISFGSLYDRIRSGDINTPGLFNEIGATQEDPETFSGARELFTLTLRAVTPGTAEFVTDPADDLVSDTVLRNQNNELVPRQIRFGSSELTIVPSGAPFTFAVDDSYPNGFDSQGLLITSAANARLNVLANDNSEAPGAIQIIDVSPATSGILPVINNNGTPNNPSDDYINYRPSIGFSGVDQFTYTIQSDVGGRSIQSTAEVTVRVGNSPTSPPLVGIDFNVLDAAGNPTSQVNVGQTFQIQVLVDDLRSPTLGTDLGVFAAYLDLLYDARLAEPRDTTGNRLGFDVQFGEDFDPNPAVGDALIPGLINEFGTFQTTLEGSADPLAGEPIELARISFVALAPGSFRLAGDPADVSPFQDTLFFDPPDTVPTDRIRYDVANLTIVSGGSGEGESQLQNPSNRWDVNDDGSVSPIDALLVVNRLNRGGEGEGASGSSSPYFWDVNGDNHISPIDALQVVNYLNRSGSSWANGEGEAAPPIGGSDLGTHSFDQAADSIFEELGQSSTDSLVADSLAPSNSGRVTTTYLGSPFAGTSDAGDDEENEEEGVSDSLHTEL